MLKPDPVSTRRSLLNNLLNDLRGKGFYVNDKQYVLDYPKDYYKTNFEQNVKSWLDSNSYSVRFWAYRKIWFLKWFPVSFYGSINFKDIEDYDGSKQPTIKHKRDSYVKIEFVSIGDSYLQSL